MTRPIARIDLRTGLPKARAVFDTLVPGRCTYSAPCVIGAMVSEGARRELDDAPWSTIGVLILGGVLAAPADQARDMVRLQIAFDYDRDFPQIFAELEAKYCTEQVRS
jgi:hypothetical protein